LDNPQRETEARAVVKALRDDLFVYRGAGRLPARNVANIGYLLYSEYLLAVEMAGTLLLVATIGAVAIAHRRKGVPA
jgi:NADH:ubiquinone oxidoreductase subunit 6 (subunit J)